LGEFVEDSKNNFELCNCRDCPTAKKSPLSGALFCARGKAEETVLEAGCMCSFCPVAEKYGLKLEYYCVRGQSAELP
jgi:hypothetical protein